MYALLWTLLLWFLPTSISPSAVSPQVPVTAYSHSVYSVGPTKPSPDFPGEQITWENSDTDNAFVLLSERQTTKSVVNKTQRIGTGDSDSSSTTFYRASLLGKPLTVALVSRRIPVWIPAKRRLVFVRTSPRAPPVFC